MNTAMKTRARTEHHHGKGDSNQRQTTKPTSKDVKKTAGSMSVLLSPASGVSDKRSLMTGSRELQNLLGHALRDEDLVRAMADTARKVCQRLSPAGRSSNLRSSPKKTELFQVVHGGDKKARDISDDTRNPSDDTRQTSDDTRQTSDDTRHTSGDAGPKKKLKFTPVQSAKDTDKTPKTGKKAAVLRMRREELSQASACINGDVPKTTREVDSTKSSAQAEGKVVTKRASKDRVLPHELSHDTRQDHSGSRPVVTSGGEKSHKSTESEPREEPQLGSLVWAKLSRQAWWPGMAIRGAYCALKPAQPRHHWIFWFGDHKVSEIPTERIVPFCAKFQDNMNGSSSKLFRKSIMESLEECVSRVRVNTGSDGDLDEDARLDWAKSGFLVNGLSSEDLTKPNPDRPIPEFAMACMRKIKAQNEADSDDDDPSDEVTREEAPFRIEKLHTRVGKLDGVRQGDISIQEVCIACGEDRAVVIQHPLFDGGLCQFCKESLMETMFIFSDDGTNMFCVICGNGGELFVCWNTECNRAYCTGCIAELTGGLASVELIKRTNPWTCFMCEDATDPACLLVRKADWQCNLVAMFQPATIHKVPQASDFDGSPIRVLSLFDGIASGKIALDELRFDVGVYYASEIDDDALLVTGVQHGSTITPLGDITKLGVTEISSLGPIDLVIGGSPCNDLSMVNPARKGLEGGTGLLFFEFFRILNLLQKLHPNCHLFWLFENVVFMSREDKTTISRFLECEPAVWNAKYFSAQNRARYFWGNIPGMYCPPELSPCPPPYVGLDSTLMGDRKAAVNKVRTVTTRSNSLMQGKKDDYFPVHTGTTGDTLWIPELERLFGFPEHYTDVGNIPPTRRQKLIGKAWSVPLIKHILAPLKAFYACIPDGPRVARVSEVTHL